MAIITDFYRSLWPIFTLSTIVGVSPMFPYRKNGRTRLYTSKKLHLITALFVILYTLSFLGTILTRSNNVVGGKFYKQRNKVSNFGITFEFISGMTVFYTIYLMSFKKTNAIGVVMRDLNRVDDLLLKMGQIFQYQRDFCCQILILLPSLLMIVLITAMQSYNLKIEKFPPISLYMWIIFIYPLIGLTVMNSQFGFTTLIIHGRFKMVAQQLQKIQRDLMGVHVKSMAFVLNVKKSKIDNRLSMKIDALAEIYNILCQSCTRTNQNYNVQMLPTLAHQFFLALYAVFYYYWMHSTKPFSAACWVCWGCLKTFEMLHVTISCHLASRASEKVGRNIHKILIKTGNYCEIEEKLMTFSQQVLQNQFKFTLCGLFNIDASLLFNMIGSSTTFIVIMIQFQEAVTPTPCAFINHTLST